jgi:hypothetical protein
MPASTVDLHRLVWAPDDFDGGKLTTSAFPKNDLMGGERYLSVSRTDILSPTAELATAERQAETQNVNFIREEALSTILNCGSVEQVADTDGITPFTVTSEEIPNENEAHCGLRNVSDKRGKGYINQLRLILVSLASGPRRLDEFLAEFAQ